MSDPGDELTRKLHRLAHHLCIRCGAKRGLSRSRNGKRIRRRDQETWLTCDSCRKKDRERKANRKDLGGSLCQQHLK